MSYTLDDVEIMLSDFPGFGEFTDLDSQFIPQRKHQEDGRRLPIPTRPRKIVNILIEFFQEHPIDPNKTWINSGIPFFLHDVRRFSEDVDVRKLLAIPNIETITQS